MRTTSWRAAASALLLLLIALAPGIVAAQSVDPSPVADPAETPAPSPQATPAPSAPTASPDPDAPTATPVPSAPVTPRGREPGVGSTSPAASGVELDLNIVPGATRVLKVTIKLPTTDHTGSGIRAWFVSESATPPALGAPGWRTIRPTTFTLSAGEGVHTVYAWAKSRNGVRSATASDTVKVDQTVPTVLLTGPSSSATRRIAVALEAADPPSGGSQPESGVTRWAVVAGTAAPGRHSLAWKTAPPTSFKLPVGNGPKIVSAFVRDAAGNVSEPSTIALDLLVSGPVVTLTLPSATASRKAPVRVTATDPGGTGLAGFYVSSNGTLPSGTITWLVHPTTVTLPAGDGPKTVYAWVKDNNGTISPRVSAATVLDTALPVVSLSAPASASTIGIGATVGATDSGSGVVAYALVNGTQPPAGASGAWGPVPPTGIVLTYGNGTKQVTAFARDAAGNISAGVTASVAMNLPAPAITSFTMPAWSRTRATAVTVALSDPGGTGVAGWYFSESSARPSLTAPGWVVAASSVTLADVQGAHTVYAWVKDRNGSISAAAQAGTNLDTIRPVVSLVSPHATRTPGVSASITTTEQGSGAVQWALVRGTDAPATGFPEWKGAPPDSITLTGGDGPKTISAFARDLAGNVSVASTTTVILDTVRPDASLDAPAATDTAAIAVTTGGTDGGSGITAYALVDGTTAPAEGSPAWTATPPVGWTVTAGDGPKTISAFTRDAAGNVSAAATRSVLLDTTAPSVGLDGPAWSSTATPWVSVWEDDFGGVGVTHWAVVLGTARPGPGSAAWVTARPTSVAVDGGDGPKTVSAWARDALGHVSPAQTRTITIDTVAPTVSLGALPAVTRDRTISVSMSGADAASGISRWAINESASAPGWGSGAWRSSPLASYTISGPEGTRTLRAWTRDIAGNVSLASAQSLILDTTAPVISFSAPTVTSVRTITLSISGTDGGGSGITGWAVVPGTAQPSQGDAAWVAAPAGSLTLPDADGDHQVTVFSRDQAGNVGSVTRTVLLDRAAPSATLAAAATSATRQVPVSVGGTDGGAGSGITRWAVVQGTVPPAAGDSGWVTSPPTTFQVTAGDGAKTISAFTRDAAGLVSPAASTTVVLDTVRPTVSLAASSTTTTDTFPVTVSGADSGGSGVDGYILIAGTAAPAANADGWTAAPPTTFTVSGGPGPKTLSAFTRDAAGNVSFAATMTVTLVAP